MRSEDEVSDFVVEWLRTDRDHKTIELLIECVRLPHLTTRSFSKLCRALRDGPSLVSLIQWKPKVAPFILADISCRPWRRNDGTFNCLQSLIEAVQKNSFVSLPEDQLARRLHYDRHIHSAWRQSKTSLVPQYFPRDENLTYRFECTKARDGRVTTTDVIQNIPEFRQNRARYFHLFKPNADKSLLMSTGFKLKLVLFPLQLRVRHDYEQLIHDHPQQAL